MPRSKRKAKKNKITGLESSLRKALKNFIDNNTAFSEEYKKQLMAKETLNELLTNLLKDKVIAQLLLDTIENTNFIFVKEFDKLLSYSGKQRHAFADTALIIHNNNLLPIAVTTNLHYTDLMTEWGSILHEVTHSIGKFEISEDLFYSIKGKAGRANIFKRLQGFGIKEDRRLVEFFPNIVSMLIEGVDSGVKSYSKEIIKDLVGTTNTYSHLEGKNKNFVNVVNNISQGIVIGSQIKELSQAEAESVVAFMVHFKIMFPDYNSNKFLKKFIKLYEGTLEFNAEQYSYFNPLATAVKYSFKKIAKTLTDAGADIDRIDKDGSIALHKALYNKDTDLVEALIEVGANLDKPDAEGNVAIYLASYLGDKKIVNMLIKGKASIDKENSEGNTALFIAIQTGNVEIVRILLNAGADPHKAGSIGRTAFGFSIFIGNLQIVEELLKKVRDVDMVDAHGQTALQQTIFSKNTEIAKALIESGADVNKARNDGILPMDIALDIGDNAMIQILSDAGAYTSSNIVKQSRREFKSQNAGGWKIPDVKAVNIQDTLSVSQSDSRYIQPVILIEGSMEQQDLGGVVTSAPEGPCIYSDGSTSIIKEYGNAPEDAIMGHCKNARPFPIGHHLVEGFVRGVMRSILGEHGINMGGVGNIAAMVATNIACSNNIEDFGINLSKSIITALSIKLANHYLIESDITDYSNSIIKGVYDMIKYNSLEKGILTFMADSSMQYVAEEFTNIALDCSKEVYSKAYDNTDTCLSKYWPTAIEYCTATLVECVRDLVPTTAITV